MNQQGKTGFEPVVFVNNDFQDHPDKPLWHIPLITILNMKN